MIAEPVPTRTDQILSEVRAAREQLHQLIQRIQRDREAWFAALAAFEQHPRLTARQRTQFRRRMWAFGRRTTRR